MLLWIVGARGLAPHPHSPARATGRRPHDRARRLPSAFAAVAPILIGRDRRDRGGLVAGRARRAACRRARRRRSTPCNDRIPGALSTAWYCPGLPASFRTRDQTLTLSNLGSVDADAVVTVQPDGGAEPDRAPADGAAQHRAILRSRVAARRRHAPRSRPTVDPSAATTTTRPGRRSRGRAPARTRSWSSRSRPTSWSRPASRPTPRSTRCRARRRRAPTGTSRRARPCAASSSGSCSTIRSRPTRAST